jgi:glycosyltransferase involved in cell wall biosynthesis
MEASAAVRNGEAARQEIRPAGILRSRGGGRRTRRLRLLFFNEGDLGTHVLGHGRLVEAHRAGLGDFPGVEARFASLTEMPRLARAAVNRPIEPLRRAGLDMQTLRWHLVQSLRARWELSRQIEQWRPDVVHLYTPAVALTMVHTMRHVPMVLAMDTTVKEWSYMPAWRPEHRYAEATLAPSRALEHRALRAAALVLARTRWVCECVEREFPDVRVLEHHPGIDLDRYRPAPRRPRERPRVLFVGGRFREKGGADLIAALAPELADGRVELDVVTPEDVPDRPGVTVHRLAPSDPRLLDLQQQADVACLPTYGDTNPWAILESMACGTPVLATRVGGIPDMIDDGLSGVLVEPGDRVGLRNTLLTLLADPHALRRLGDGARRRCETRYDARRQFGELVELVSALARG